MAHDVSPENDPRVLSPEVFDFVLNNELKRAIRSQNYLTLLVVEPIPKPGADGRLSVVLLDADFEHALLVVERLMARVEHYEFTTPAAVSIGVASCPTHGADLVSLRSAAQSRPIHTRRAPRGSSNTQ